MEIEMERYRDRAQASSTWAAMAAVPPRVPATTGAVDIPVGQVRLDGLLALPSHARGVIVFAQGSGSGRSTPRTTAVAGVLSRSGYGTLLIDLLTAEEEAEELTTGRPRSDIRLLAERVIGAIDWLGADAIVGDVPPALARLPMGCFGASTGAAAALVAAAERPERVAAVVSRGGRPDLAGDDLRRVGAATLLIVGGDDVEMIRLNQQALAALNAESRLEIVPGAGHLFAEPGALQRVAALTLDWFERHLAVSGHRGG